MKDSTVFVTIDFNILSGKYDLTYIPLEDKNMHEAFTVNFAPSPAYLYWQILG